MAGLRERKATMAHTVLIGELRELLKKRRALGPAQHRELVLSELVREGIYTVDYKITDDYGGPHPKKETP